MPSSELHAVATTFGLTWVEIERLVTNAIDSSFAPLPVRATASNATRSPPWFAREAARSPAQASLAAC